MSEVQTGVAMCVVCVCVCVCVCVFTRHVCVCMGVFPVLLQFKVFLDLYEQPLQLQTQVG